jgi:hypothetical protein
MATGEGTAAPPGRCHGRGGLPAQEMHGRGGLHREAYAAGKMPSPAFLKMFFMWRNRGGTLIGKKRIFLEIFVK